MTTTRMVICLAFVWIVPTAASARDRQVTRGGLEWFSSAIPRPPMAISQGTSVSVPKHPPLPRARPDQSPTSRAEPMHGNSGPPMLVPVAPLD